MKFVSHLDMNRFMTRLVNKAKIPIWFTEGFNQHAYFNFAVPLSLGFEGQYEILDLRIIDPKYSNEQLVADLNKASIPDIEFVSAKEPVAKMKEIAFAEFKINFEDSGSVADNLNSFLNSGSIKVLKKSKKGIIKELELADKIARFEISATGNTQLKIVLTAGTDNVNPQLLLSAFEDFLGKNLPEYSITRTMLYTENLEEFC